MELKSKLYLIDEEGNKFMGIGVLWLLEMVAEHNSLRKAALALGISYSTAFSMELNLEKSIGVSFLNRRKGGANRDGATLTEFATEFLALYRQFEQKAKENLKEPYEQFQNNLGMLLDQVDECKGEE